MSKAAQFRANAAEAELSASAVSNPLLKEQFLQIARSWRALAEQIDKIDAVLASRTADKTGDP